MTTPTHPRDRDTPFVCRQCAGPCRTYAGDFHGWTCRACLADYVEAQNDAPPNIVERTARRRPG